MPRGPTQVHLPRPGDLVSIAGQDYLGGCEPITGVVVEIDASIGPLQLRRLEWIHVVVADSGRPDAEPRTLIVRIAALGPRASSIEGQNHAVREIADHPAGTMAGRADAQHT